MSSAPTSVVPTTRHRVLFRSLACLTALTCATASCVVTDDDRDAEEDVGETSDALVDGVFTQRNDIYDYLVMDVCTTGGPDGALDRSRLPHQCRASGNWRNLTPAVTSGTSLTSAGDELYYRTHNVFRHSSSVFAYGHSAWSSYPIVHDGVRRILLVKDHGRVPAGADRFGQLAAGERDGVSVRWMGNTNAFMTLTVSPDDYGYAVSKSTCGQGVPAKFHNYWHMPKDMPTRTPGAVWADVGTSKLVAGIHPNKVPACDRIAYEQVYNTAVRSTGFAFTGGMTLQTIVHHKFSGSSPHSGEAFERIYFTREYGITRWERWKKDPAAGKGFYDAQLAPVAGSPAACTKPFGYPSGDGLTTGALAFSTTSGYSQKYRTTGSFESFHMTDCEDFTGRIVTGADLDKVYGTLKGVKWSFLEIKSFLARPVSGDPLPDAKQFFFAN